MYGEKFKQAPKSLMSYCRENMGYDKDPDVHYVTDKSNANSMLGTTAHYQPDNQVVTVYISNRHPKDVLRSLAHELVHHAQNVRGDLQNAQTEEGYAQKDPHMRKMEEEAYLTGNMMFRDWEDTCKANSTLNLSLPSTIGENKMNDQLKKLIAEKVIMRLDEQGIKVSSEVLERFNVEEEKKKGKYDDGDGKDEKCDYVDCDDEGEKDKVEEKRRTYGSRPKGDKPHNLFKDKLGSFGKDHEDRVDAAADKKHKEELAAARSRLEKNPDSYKVKGGRKKKKVKENELADIKSHNLQSVNLMKTDFLISTKN